MRVLVVTVGGIKWPAKTNTQVVCYPSLLCELMRSVGHLNLTARCALAAAERALTFWLIGGAPLSCVAFRCFALRGHILQVGKIAFVGSIFKLIDSSHPIGSIHRARRSLRREKRVRDSSWPIQLELDWPTDPSRGLANFPYLYFKFTLVVSSPLLLSLSR